MRHISDKAVILLRELQENSDENHRLSMAELTLSLQRHGIHAERKSVYQSLAFLKDIGYPVHFSRAENRQGYWIDHPFSVPEAFLISDAVASSPAISRKDTERLLEKTAGFLSVHERKLLHVAEETDKEEQNTTLQTIGLLLSAIEGHHPVEFLYYDLTITKEKKYRRNASIYRQVPYAIVSFQSRYYCVCWSPDYKDFANYRIDKMDHVTVPEEHVETVPFDLRAWMKQSFYMYRGDPVTVVIQADLSMAQIVFDQFGTDIIITSVKDHSFTAGIRTSISPTLVAWLLEFHDRIRVLRPKSLTDQLLAIAEDVENTYNGKEKGRQLS